MCIRMWPHMLLYVVRVQIVYYSLQYCISVRVVVVQINTNTCTCTLQKKEKNSKGT